MSLYTPKHFSGSADDAVALMRAQAFATLVTCGVGEPDITHLPLLWDAGSMHGVLSGHMARANPHWERFAQGHTLAIFTGPHAYVSPAWYEAPQREVPTWNYATVHAHGRPQLVEDRDEKLALIDRSVSVFEAGNAPPWTRVLEGDRLDAMLRAIVAFRMPIERIDAKFKMSQNKTAADRARVAARLDASAHPDLRAMAAWMRAHE